VDSNPLFLPKHLLVERPPVLAALVTLFLLQLVSCLAWPEYGQAQSAKPLHGVALVIGESHYLELPGLSNPANDARAVAQLLGNLGFEVNSVADGDASRLKISLSRFVQDAAGADVALDVHKGGSASRRMFIIPGEAQPSRKRSSLNLPQRPGREGLCWLISSIHVFA